MNINFFFTVATRAITKFAVSTIYYKLYKYILMTQFL